MKNLKSIAIALVAVGIVVGGWFYYQHINRDIVVGGGERLLPWPTPQIHKIILKRGSQKIVLEKKGNWFLREPMDFQADNGIVEHELGEAYHAKSKQTFQYLRDKYGNNLGSVTFVDSKGKNLTLYAGDKLPPGGGQYIINTSDRKVHIVDPFWDEFFKETANDLIVKQLHRDSFDIRELEFRNGGKTVWSVKPKGENSKRDLIVSVDGKVVEPNSKRPRRQWRQIRTINQEIASTAIEKILFDEKDLPDPAAELLIKGREKSLLLKINKDKNKIFSSSLGTVVSVKPENVDKLLLSIRNKLLGVDKKRQ